LIDGAPNVIVAFPLMWIRARLAVWVVFCFFVVFSARLWAGPDFLPPRSTAPPTQPARSRRRGAMGHRGSYAGVIFGTARLSFWADIHGGVSFRFVGRTGRRSGTLVYESGLSLGFAISWEHSVVCGQTRLVRGCPVLFSAKAPDAFCPIEKS